MSARGGELLVLRLQKFLGQSTGRGGRSIGDETHNSTLQQSGSPVSPSAVSRLREVVKVSSRKVPARGVRVQPFRASAHLVIGADLAIPRQKLNTARLFAFRVLVKGRVPPQPPHALSGCVCLSLRSAGLANAVLSTRVVARAPRVTRSKLHKLDLAALTCRADVAALPHSVQERVASSSTAASCHEPRVSDVYAELQLYGHRRASRRA